MPKLIEPISLQVKARRKQKGLSQEALAKLVGTSEQTIWNIENKKKGISFDTIAKLAEVLDCEETDLLSPLSEAKKREEKSNLPSQQDWRDIKEALGKVKTENIIPADILNLISKLDDHRRENYFEMMRETLIQATSYSDDEDDENDVG